MRLDQLRVVQRSHGVLSGVGASRVAQDTGWTAHLPAAKGSSLFPTPEEALAGIDRVNGDYPGARRAVEIARECFDAARPEPPVRRRPAHE